MGTIRVQQPINSPYKSNTIEAPEKSIINTLRNNQVNKSPGFEAGFCPCIPCEVYSNSWLQCGHSYDLVILAGANPMSTSFVQCGHSTAAILSTEH